MLDFIARRLIAIIPVLTVVAVLIFMMLRLTSTAVGFVRDEGYYFKAAEDYISWYRRFLTGATSLVTLLHWKHSMRGFPNC